MTFDEQRRPARAPAVVALVLVLAVAAGIRLVHHVQIEDGPLLRLHHWAQSDMHFYNNWARHIVAGDLLTDREMRPYHAWHRRIAREVHDATDATGPFDESAMRRMWNRWLGEKTFYEDPLYPYFLAVVYGVFGYNVRTALNLQMLLGMGSVALVYCLALVLFDVPVALLAGLTAALFGPLLVYEGVLLRSAALTFMGLVTLWVIVIASGRPQRSRWFLLAGCMFGLAFMLKSSTLLFAVAATTLAGFRLRHDVPRLVRNMGMIVVGFMMVVSPLVARNIAVGATPFGLPSSGAITFINHNTEDYHPETGEHLSVHAATIMQRTDGELLPSMMQTLKTHRGPESWLWLVWRKFLAFWHWYEVPNNANYYYFRLHARALSAVAVDYYVIAPLAVLGLLLSVHRSYAHALNGIYLICGVATILMFFNLARFRVPIACGMIPFAAFGFVFIVRLVIARRFAAAAAAVTAVALLTASILRPLPATIGSLFRTADFGVANEIAGHYVLKSAQRGRLTDALRMLERQLETEPADLRIADPGPAETRISVLSASVAGSFADLHEIGATLNGKLERFRRADEHSRRAEVLRAIEANFDRRGETRGDARVRAGLPQEIPGRRG